MEKEGGERKAVLKNLASLPFSSLLSSHPPSSVLPPSKLSQYITNTKFNSALHPSGVGKLSTGLGLSGWGQNKTHSPVSGSK